jgi:hypothetical protein
MNHCPTWVKKSRIICWVNKNERMQNYENKKFGTDYELKRVAASYNIS